MSTWEGPGARLRLEGMDSLVPLLTLTLMEVVLGIDNIVFLSILVSALPAEKQKTARFVGLGLALVARLGLLLGIKWVMGLEAPLFHWSSLGWVPDGWVESHHVDVVTGRDVVLIVGGIFLLVKSVTEIHKKTVGGESGEVASRAKGASFASILAQIVALDLVFSLDSVISAIGMAKDVWVMVVAMVVAVGFMGAFAGKVSRFIDANPTFKMLGLSFLMMIGEGVGTPINKNYVYAAMVFSLLVEILNTRARKRVGHAVPTEHDV
jgi:predicted tellurium resistance membrane protein TerC